MQRGFESRVARSCRVLGFAFALVYLGYTSPSWALNDSDKEAVRSLSNEAAADFGAGHFDEARKKFTRAYAIARVPKLAVWLARSNERLGKLVAAYEYYRQATALQREDFWVGDTQEEAQREAAAELATLTPRLARVTVVVEGVSPNDARVRVGGAQIPTPLLGVERFVDPGLCEFLAEADGDVVRKSANLHEGERLKVVLTFDAKRHAAHAATDGRGAATNAPQRSFNHGQNARPPGSSHKTDPLRLLTWGMLGVGAAGLATGTVTGVMVASRYNELDGQCGKDCEREQPGKVESYRTLRTVSTVGFIAGGVGAAVGLTLLFTGANASDRRSGDATLALRMVPGMAFFEGGF